jgi:hypothetical protein
MFQDYIDQAIISDGCQGRRSKVKQYTECWRMINQNRTQCPNGCQRAALDAFIIITNPVAIGLN